MPTFYVDDFDIDPSEFVSSCSKREIEELIECLIDDGHINKNCYSQNKNKNINDLVWEESMDKLINIRLLLSKEDEETILKIANKH